MVADGRTIYIAGAGIAGLTLALALAKFGATVVVLERTEKLVTAGAGIQISPNARCVLDRLGLSRQLTQYGLVPEAIDIYPFRRPRPLISLKIGEEAQKLFGAPYAVIHRADLADILFNACRRFANIDIQFGVRQFDIATHARGLSIAIEDAGHNTRNARPFAFIGADGVHSRTRTVIMSGPEAKYSGYVAWRTMIPISMLAEKGILAKDRTSLLWGPGFHLVAYPHPRHDRFNVALFTKEKLDDARKISTVKGPSLPRMLLKSPQIEAIIENAIAGWSMWPLNAVSTSQWHKGPVGLIGDAAHAMLPFQAQGAAMGIEDAAILAPLLVTEPDATSALARYQSLRKKRVERVQRVSARNGMIYHMEWPFTLARDMVVSAQGPKGHFNRLRWLYGYDPNPEVNTVKTTQHFT